MSLSYVQLQKFQRPKSFVNAVKLELSLLVAICCLGLISLHALRGIRSVIYLRSFSFVQFFLPVSLLCFCHHNHRHIFKLQTFKDVTILYSDVVGFTNICTKISPMEVVSMLNAMYTKFDHLSVQYGVYKVFIDISKKWENSET